MTLEGGRDSLEISVFKNFFHKNYFQQNYKTQKFHRLRITSKSSSDYRWGIPVIKERFLQCAVKEAMLLQISEVFPIEDCCLNFSHEKTFVQQTLTPSPSPRQLLYRRNHSLHKQGHSRLQSRRAPKMSLKQFC